MKVRILCKPPENPIDGFGILEECEEVIVGGKFRRADGSPLTRKFRRLILRNFDFPLDPTQTQYILFVEDPQYYSYLSYRIVSFNMNSHPDEFEWVLEQAK